jgi:hypothetical protein
MLDFTISESICKQDTLRKDYPSTKVTLESTIESNMGKESETAKCSNLKTGKFYQSDQPRSHLEEPGAFSAIQLMSVAKINTVKLERGKRSDAGV